MLSVAMIVFPNVQSLDVSGPMDVFEEANGFLSADRHYKVTLVGPSEQVIRASNVMLITAHKSYEDAPEEFDLVLVAGGPSLPVEHPDPAILSCVLRLMATAKRYGSVCTGAFVLGHAGLLDGRRVTTHWQNAEALAAQFPFAQVDRDRIYIRDGALLTSAGVTAGIDLALAIVNEDHGSTVALAVAKRLVVFAQRQGGQSQFSPYIAAPSEDGSTLGDIYRFVMANLKEKLSVGDLAVEAGMSKRNFARFFLQQAKTTPGEFVEQARVDAARNLLEGSSLALKEIAFECGFGTPHRMRQVFSRRLGVTPGQYRGSFRRE
jgi:transcriptional regulator GlxA family with amidase domain